MTRFLALLLLTVPLATGCASTRYEPARSPRIAFVSNAVVKDGKKYPNYFGGGVVEAVRGNPRAETEARKGRALVVGGSVLAIVGISAELVGLAASVAGTRFDETTGETSQTTSGEVGSAMVIGGILVAIVGAVVTFQGPPHLVDAVNIYNDGVDASGASPSGVPGGVGIRPVTETRPGVQSCTERVKPRHVRTKPGGGRAR